jgi:uncharacterized protein YbjT (DUF2867 family)
VVRHLLQRRLAVRALVQNPHSDRAKALADHGIEIAQGDMDDPASLKKRWLASTACTASRTTSR